MAPRAALSLVPALAVLAVGALVLGPGRERAILGARVWGVPAEGSARAAWRIETTERQLGEDRPVALDALELSVAQAGRPIAAWAGVSGADGMTEVLLEGREPFAGRVDLRLARGASVLAEGAIALERRPAPELRRRAVEGHAEGAIALSVEIERGILASPFAGAVVARASLAGKPAAEVTLRVTAEGAQLVDAGPLRTGEDGAVRIGLRPTWHSIELHIDAAGPPDASGSWEGTLPVKPGALWLSADPRRVAIASPVPRERAYVSGLGEHGRVFGAIVPLARAESGLFEGELPVAALEQRGVRALTVAGDAAEAGAGTVTWPLQGTEGVASAPRLELLLDGMPSAERAEKKRASSARFAATAVALAAALFEAALLVLHSRASQAALAAHLASVSEDDADRAAAARITGSRAGRAFKLAVAIGLVLLAFGSVAAFTLVR